MEYEKPVAEVIYFSNRDVITTSVIVCERGMSKRNDHENCNHNNQLFQ